MAKGKEVGRFDEEAEKNSSLNQVMKTLEDAFEKMEKAYQENDAEDFNKAKIILLQTQRKLIGVSIR